jgi:hypothetical protein
MQLVHGLLVGLPITISYSLGMDFALLIGINCSSIFLFKLNLNMQVLNLVTKMSTISMDLADEKTNNGKKKI